MPILYLRRAIMKLAIVGSRKISADIGKHIPQGVSEIVSGGAAGIDTLAAEYARKNGIKLTEFLPDYSSYKRAAPLKRNQIICEYADSCLAFWDGESRGTLYTIKLFKKMNKPVTVVTIVP